MLTAAQIMVTDVVTVPPDATISDAVDIMLQNRISGMPVTEDDGTLRGIISEFALLAISYDPASLDHLVQDHMTGDVTSVTEDVDLRVIADIMISQRLRRLPVVRDHRLIGSISRRDVLRAVRQEQSTLAGRSLLSKSASD